MLRIRIATEGMLKASMPAADVGGSREILPSHRPSPKQSPRARRFGGAMGGAGFLLPEAERTSEWSRARRASALIVP